MTIKKRRYPFLHCLLMLIIFFLPLFFSANCYAKESNDQGFVSSDWLKKAQAAIANPKSNLKDLIVEFGKEHKSKLFPTEPGLVEEPYLKIVSNDIDGDGRQEIFLFISGINYTNTMLYVLSPGDNHWKIIHEEYVWMHNQEPRFEFYNAANKQKIFMLTHLYYRGTGHWLFSYRFYRMTGGKFLCVLEIPEDSNLYEWSDLNGRAETTKLSVLGDSIYVTFKYQYYPSDEVKEKLKINPGKKDETFLIDREDEAIFKWKAETHEYTLMPSTLNNNKIKCFMDIWNVELFRKEFRNDLINLIKFGKPDQKKVAEYFLYEYKE
jgi:hypothetical protein